MLLDRCLELFDVLCPPLPKCCLGLAVSLLPFLGSCIDLEVTQSPGNIAKQRMLPPTGFRPPLRFCTWATSCTNSCSSNSGEDSEKDSSSECSFFGTAGKSAIFDMPVKKVVELSSTTRFRLPTNFSFR